MSDNGHLDFEGSPLHATKTTIKGVIASPSLLHHDDTVHALVRATVADVRFPKKKGLVERVHVLDIERGQVIDDALATDVLAEDEERTTGQMRLLSLEGEVHRAARAAATERMRAIDLGHDGPEHDGLDLADLLAVTKDYLDAAQAYDADELGPEAWFDACERDLVKAAGLCLAAITWVRRRKAEHDEEQRRIEAESIAERLAAQAKAMAESSDENADKRERRGLTDEDEDEQDEQDEQEEALT